MEIAKPFFSINPLDNRVARSNKLKKPNLAISSFEKGQILNN